MKEYALVTGATSGIGLELARCFAQDGIPLILTGRNAQKLQGLRTQLTMKHHVEVHTVVKDLSQESAAEELFEEIQSAGLFVKYLVNNAGVGTYGLFPNITLEKEQELVRLNIYALLTLSKLFLKDMVEHNTGRILNVASLAAFQPGPVMANYYASKAYVLSLSEALSVELAPTRISVSALCPGPVKTQFQETSGMKKTLAAQKLMMDAKTVADEGYRGMMKGKTVIIPGRLSKCLPYLVRVLPRALAARIPLLTQDEY